MLWSLPALREELRAHRLAFLDEGKGGEPVKGK